MKCIAKDNDVVLATVLGPDSAGASAYATLQNGKAIVRSEAVGGVRSAEELLVQALWKAHYWMKGENGIIYVPCRSLLGSIIDRYSAKTQELRPTRLIDQLLQLKAENMDWKITPEDTRDYGWDNWPEHLKMYRAARKAATEALRAHGMIPKPIQA